MIGPRREDGSRQVGAHPRLVRYFEPSARYSPSPVRPSRYCDRPNRGVVEGGSECGGQAHRLDAGRGVWETRGALALPRVGNGSFAILPKQVLVGRATTIRLYQNRAFDPQRGAAFYGAKYAGRLPGQIHFGGTLAGRGEL